jgi:hypothetical protein
MTIHRIVGATCGAALRPGWDYRPALDENAALGFNLVRVFAGRLAWCGQTDDGARERLPEFLGHAHQRGLNVEVTANTDAAGGAYDVVQHTAEVCRMLSPFDLLEQANEPWDVEQQLSPQFLRDLPRPSGVPVALGAAQTDEERTYADAGYVTAHLDRGRPKWNMVRRVRELEALSAMTGKHVVNNEPIGAGERDEAGKRESDPAVFYAMGALNRLMEVGGIFHSSDGLMAQPLGPNQRRCAQAFIASSRVMGDGPRLAYRNAGHDGSPVKDIRFNDGDMGREGCTRCYSGIVGVDGFSVAVGVSGDPGIVWNWSRREVIGEMGGRVRVYRVGL